MFPGQIFYIPECTQAQTTDPVNSMEQEDEPAAVPVPDSSKSPDSQSTVENVSLKELKDAIQKVRQRGPCVPSICAYSVLNAHQGSVPSVYISPISCDLLLRNVVCQFSVQK